MKTIIERTTTEDLWIDGTAGRLFARIWSPSAPSGLAPIILLHDSLGSVELWRGFGEALCAATKRQIIAYDRLGFGQSAPHPAILALDFIAKEAEGDFAAVKNQLGIDRFILFGHSVGGGMAVNCAARFSDRCGGLITESAQGFVEDRTVQGLKEAQELFKDPKQVDRLKKYHGEKAQWVLDAWINSWLHPAFAQWSLQPILPEVKCPLLVIHGVDDEYGSPKHPQMIAEFSGGPAQLALMPDTRHIPHREKASEVVEMVRRFTSSLD